MNSIQKALIVTGGFEGSKGFTNIAGDFDGQGLSFGVLQWNAGQGTLQTIFRLCMSNMPETVKEIFGDGFETFKAALSDNASFLKWCKSINDKSHRIEDPWYFRFVNLAKTEGCQKIQMQAAGAYIVSAKALMGKYSFISERAFALCFDIAVQNGSVLPAADYYFKSHVQPSMSEKQKLLILAQAVASASKPEYRSDVLSRKQAIAQGFGTVHKRTFTLDLSDNRADFGDFR